MPVTTSCNKKATKFIIELEDLIREEYPTSSPRALELSCEEFKMFLDKAPKAVSVELSNGRVFLEGKDIQGDYDITMSRSFVQGTGRYLLRGKPLFSESYLHYRGVKLHYKGDGRVKHWSRVK